MAYKKHNIAITTITAIAALIVCGGAITLLVQTSSTDVLATELIALGVSVAALALAVLAGLHNASEARMLRIVARDLQKTIDELRDINQDNESIKRKLAQDYAVDKKIADALDEIGVGEDDGRRTQIASHIKSKIR